MRSSAWWPCSQEDDGNALGAAVAAQFPEHAVPVHARHHLVQQDEVRLVPAGHFQGRQAVVGRQRDVSGTFQVVGDEVRNGVIVFSDKDGCHDCFLG